jgi:hypothetical protein
MMGSLLRAGDAVTITIEKESREWGYNPCPDGTAATVVGFEETYHGRILGLAPGVYANEFWVRLRFADGKESTEFAGRIELTDKEESERRVAAYREALRLDPDYWKNSRQRLRDLPGTPFWEMDWVRAARTSGVVSIYERMPPSCRPEILQVVGIDYHHLATKCLDGSKFPAYRISSKVGAGWDTSASEDDLVLEERGPVWKHYHKEPLSFPSLREEGNFFDWIGEADEVRNPASGLYAWTKEEALEAIRKGIAHGFSASNGLFGDGPYISVKRFKDPGLGARIAVATLEGFGR